METPKTAVVFGAGLAGLCVSQALLARGWGVQLREAGPAVATRASGNSAGLFKPILTPTATLPSRLSFQAFDELLRLLSELVRLGHAPAHSTSGLMQIPRREEEAHRFRKALSERLIDAGVARWLDPEEASARAGWRLPWGAVWFERGGWLDPSDLCHKLLAVCQASPRFEFVTNSSASLEDLGRLRSEVRHSHLVVFCISEASRALPDFREAQTQVIRGQISEIDAPEGLPPFVLAFHEYVIQRGAGRVFMGATHDRGDESVDARASDHRRLLERIGEAMPPVLAQSPFTKGPARVRAGLRFTRAEHLPILSELPESSYALAMPTWALTAMGSRGILWAPILARSLAARVSGTEEPLSEDLVRALSLF